MGKYVVRNLKSIKEYDNKLVGKIGTLIEVREFEDGKLFYIDIKDMGTFALYEKEIINMNTNKKDEIYELLRWITDNTHILMKDFIRYYDNELHSRLNKIIMR